MMRSRALFAAFVGVAVLAGCASRPPSPYANDLNAARDALAAGRTEAAMRTLDQVQAGKKLSAQDRGVVTLLEAEAALASGEARGALLRASEVKDKALKPQADEIAGKALIKLGRYDEAIERLDAAGEGYTDGADRARVQDLTRVAEGLSAYAAGRAGEAREIWSEIENAGLRRSLESSLDRRGVKVAARP